MSQFLSLVGIGDNKGVEVLGASYFELELGRSNRSVGSDLSGDGFLDHGS